MKIVLSFTALAFIAFSCVTTPKTEDQAAESAETEEITLGKSYGEYEINIEEAISVEEMVADFASKTEDEFYTFNGELNEVCSKAGCWVNIDKGNGETFMVRFKDHFTIPPATEVGTEAYFHGRAHWDTVSVELLQHFAEDAGKSQEEINEITEPKFEMGFEADGIALKK